MSQCLGCGIKTSRIYKLKVGRYTLCDSCINKGYNIDMKYGVYFLTNVNDPKICHSCHEVLIGSVFWPERR